MKEITGLRKWLILKLGGCLPEKKLTEEKPLFSIERRDIERLECCVEVPGTVYAVYDDYYVIKYVNDQILEQLVEKLKNNGFITVEKDLDIVRMVTKYYAKIDVVK